MNRRHVLKLLAASALAGPACAAAQGAYPDRLIKWVVPYPAGGGTDAVIDELVPLLDEGDIVVDGTSIAVVLPGVALGAIAGYSRYQRNAMLDVLGQDLLQLGALPDGEPVTGAGEQLAVLPRGVGRPPSALVQLPHPAPPHLGDHLVGLSA